MWSWDLAFTPLKRVLEKSFLTVTRLLSWARESIFPIHNTWSFGFRFNDSVSPELLMTPSYIQLPSFGSPNQRVGFPGHHLAVIMVQMLLSQLLSCIFLYGRGLPDHSQLFQDQKSSGSWEALTITCLSQCQAVFSGDGCIFLSHILSFCCLGEQPSTCTQTKVREQNLART